MALRNEIESLKERLFDLEEKLNAFLSIVRVNVDTQTMEDDSLTPPTESKECQPDKQNSDCEALI